MDSCCRVCSRSDEFRRFSLFAVAEVSQEVIANMIRDTSDTQVSSEDGLPQHICPDCLMTLSLAYSFRKQCRRSDAKFREYWGGRTPSQSIDQQQPLLPRRSQSQAPDDGSFTAIKEEVDIYDYEYSVPSHHDNQWVIQNPRTIGEGAMTVVHNSGHYFDEPAASGSAAHDGAGADRDGSSVMPMVTAHLDGGHHDPAEMGESSGLAQKGDKLMKKKAPTPERYSQRIRRQSEHRNTDSEAELGTAVIKVRNPEKSATVQSRAETTKESLKKPRNKKATHQPVRKRRFLSSHLKTQLDAAVLRVYNREMSTAEAAESLGLSISTVRRHLESLRLIKKCQNEKISNPSTKYRLYSKKQLDAAVLKVCNKEMEILKAVELFGIPKATLERHVKKKRLIMKRQNEQIINPGTKYQLYSQDQLDAAVLKVYNREMMLAEAVELFGIPRCTIHRHVKKKRLSMERQDGAVPVDPVTR